jgi:hypothetical protein
MQSVGQLNLAKFCQTHGLCTKMAEGYSIVGGMEIFQVEVSNST